MLEEKKAIDDQPLNNPPEAGSASQSELAAPSPQAEAKKLHVEKVEKQECQRICAAAGPDSSQVEAHRSDSAEAKLTVESRPCSVLIPHCLRRLVDEKKVKKGKARGKARETAENEKILKQGLAYARKAVDVLRSRGKLVNQTVPVPDSVKIVWHLVPLPSSARNNRGDARKAVTKMLNLLLGWSSAELKLHNDEVEKANEKKTKKIPHLGGLVEGVRDEKKLAPVASVDPAGKKVIHDAYAEVEMKLCDLLEMGFEYSDGRAIHPDSLQAYTHEEYWGSLRKKVIDLLEQIADDCDAVKSEVLCALYAGMLAAAQLRHYQTVAFFRGYTHDYTSGNTQYTHDDAVANLVFMAGAIRSVLPLDFCYCLFPRWLRDFYTVSFQPIRDKMLEKRDARRPKALRVATYKAKQEKKKQDEAKAKEKRQNRGRCSPCA